MGDDRTDFSPPFRRSCDDGFPHAFASLLTLTSVSVMTSAMTPLRGLRLQPDDRRAAILDAAREVFATRGYALANVADICAAAGIARGTFYLYFENKSDILVAVLRAVEDRVREVLATRQPLEKAIGRLARTDAASALGFCESRLADVLGAIVTDEKSLRVVMREARAAGGAIAETIERIDDVVLEALERDLRLAQEARLFRRGDTRLIARYILGGVEKVLLLALAKDEPIDLPVIIRECVKIELFGLLTDEVRKWR